MRTPASRASEAGILAEIGRKATRQRGPRHDPPVLVPRRRGRPASAIVRLSAYVVVILALRAFPGLGAHVTPAPRDAPGGKPRGSAKCDLLAFCVGQGTDHAP